MTDKDALKQAIKALRIYDACMSELSFFVGHMRGRCTEAAHDQARSVCAVAMKAQKILHRLDPNSKGPA